MKNTFNFWDVSKALIIPAMLIGGHLISRGLSGVVVDGMSKKCLVEFQENYINSTDDYCKKSKVLNSCFEKNSLLNLTDKEILLNCSKREVDKL